MRAVQRRNPGGSGTARRNVADNRWISSRPDNRLSAGGSGGQGQATANESRHSASSLSPLLSSAAAALWTQSCHTSMCTIIAYRSESEYMNTCFSITASSSLAHNTSRQLQVFAAKKEPLVYAHPPNPSLCTFLLHPNPNPTFKKVQWPIIQSTISGGVVSHLVWWLALPEPEDSHCSTCKVFKACQGIFVG